MSICPTWQWRAISAAASAGIRPSRPCTRASAASTSRYFWVRFSSDHTPRISPVEKMFPKIAESTTVDGMPLLSGEK